MDQLVEAGASVVALVRDDVPETSVVRRWIGRVNQVRGSVEILATVERLIAEYGVTSVFHLAAQSQVEVANRSPASTFEANITGTWSVLEACRTVGGVEQVVLASSDKAYGDQPVLPYTEDMPLEAVHPYDVSKACSDLLGRCYARSYGLPVATTRCGNIFGPGDTNWRRLVPGIVRYVLEGERPVIRSDGKSTRDYLYVVDAALAYVRLAEAMARDGSLAGEAFNFSTDTPLSVLDLVSLIQKAAATDYEPDVQGTATNEISHQHLSSEKARSRFGWEPSFTVDEALAATVAWYRDELGLGG